VSAFAAVVGQGRTASLFGEPAYLSSRRLKCRALTGVLHALCCIKLSMSTQ